MEVNGLQVEQFTFLLSILFLIPLQLLLILNIFTSFPSSVSHVTAIIYVIVIKCEKTKLIIY